jgi:hypothetical protein
MHICRTRYPAIAFAIIAGIAAPFTLAGGGAQASPPPNPAHVVNPVPSANTPNIADGTVRAIQRIAGKVIAGGSFTSVMPPGSKTGAVTRRFLLAYDAATGAVDPAFAPVVDGVVNALLPGPNPGTVYAVGSFSTVNGAAAKSVVLLDAATGQLVPSFNPAVMNGVGNTAVLTGGHLIIGGPFTTVGGASHAGLVALDPVTGAVQNYVNIQLAGHHGYRGLPGQAKGGVGAKSIAVSPDGKHLVVIGNFTSTAGLPRDQIALVSLGATASVDQTWATTAFRDPCVDTSYDSWIREVKWSPDGSYFVVVATGGNGSRADGSLTMCGSASRWNAGDSGADVQPAWVDRTGWDAIDSVTVAEGVVYVGGHFRYLNNSFGWNQPDDGSQARASIAALDPSNGMPLAWNPGRIPRGAGISALVADSDGLYVGGDTDYIGNRQYYRGKIAFFPLAGGPTIQPAAPRPQLPGRVVRVVSGSTSLGGYVFDGKSVSGAAPAVAAPNFSGTSVRAAFMIGNSLYYLGASTPGGDATMVHQRIWNGTSFGPEIQLDPYHDAKWDNIATGTRVQLAHRGQQIGPFDPTSMTYFTGMPADILLGEGANIQGMFYSGGRVYYSLKGSPDLHYRYFEPDTGAFGAEEYTVAGVDLHDAAACSFPATPCTGQPPAPAS